MMMVDPSSIVGLTIAIFDQLLKLGERTAQLIDDVRTFGEDTSTLYAKLNDENNRTKQLKHVLFEPSPVYGGSALFEKFDEDVQDQLKIFLGRLVFILSEGFDLLHRRYGTRESLMPPRTTSSPTQSTSSLSSLAGRPKYTLSLLRWSLRDKKRTEEILNNFSDLNRRIHENIKLWILASSIGLDFDHLQRLRNDTSSINLGFNVDASLRIALIKSPGDVQPDSYELKLPWSEEGNQCILSGEQFSTAKLNGQDVLLEYHDYEAPSSRVSATGEFDPRTKERVESLARLLHQPKEQVFYIPPCIGWKFVPSSKRISFAFEIPVGAEPKQTSLLQILDISDIKPTLGEKFELAFKLARSMSMLQMVKWVHESFRSENILFFPPRTSKNPFLAGKAPNQSLNLDRPCILGFDFSRPEADFSLGLADDNIARNVYRHPERQGQPGRMFNKLHDIYALGVVLLEIGLWEKAITLEKNGFAHARDPYSIQAQLRKQAERRLGPRVGDKYKQLVLKCLTGDFGVENDTKEDLKLQQAFRTQVVDVLERAADSV